MWMCSGAEFLSILLGACRTDKARAHAALQVIHRLTDPDFVPLELVNTIKVNLAKQHGVHVLCQLLCPKLEAGSKGQHDSLAQNGMHLQKHGMTRSSWKMSSAADLSHSFTLSKTHAKQARQAQLGMC